MNWFYIENLLPEPRTVTYNFMCKLFVLGVVDLLLFVSVLLTAAPHQSITVFAGTI